MEPVLSSRRKGDAVARILTAATAVFSEAGFGGTRVDEIARRAGVNKATIYYHIGSKETLYGEVIRSVIGNVAEKILAGVREDQSPEEKMKTYIRSIIMTIENNPRMAPIMMRELASGGAHFPPVVGRDIARIIGILTDILEEGVKKGIFIPTVPFILHMMVIGSLMFYRASAPVRAKLEWIPEVVKQLSAGINEEVAGEIEKLILRAISR
jgi:AcrR family transcriptional regulator